MLINDCISPRIITKVSRRPRRRRNTWQKY